MLLQGSSQVMFGVSIPGLLMIGYAFALIILFLGRQEKDDMGKKLLLIKIGVILLGLMIVITPLSWYGYYAATSGSILITLSDVVILASGCSLGGIVMGIGLKHMQQN